MSDNKKDTKEGGTPRGNSPEDLEKAVPKRDPFKFVSTQLAVLYSIPSTFLNPWQPQDFKGVSAACYKCVEFGPFKGRYYGSVASNEPDYCYQLLTNEDPMKFSGESGFIEYLKKNHRSKFPAWERLYGDANHKSKEQSQIPEGFTVDFHLTAALDDYMQDIQEEREKEGLTRPIKDNPSNNTLPAGKESDKSKEQIQHLQNGSSIDPGKDTPDVSLNSTHFVLT